MRRNDVGNQPRGKPVFALQDRGVFRIEDSARYPARHGPARDASIRHGWAVDYASNQPSFIAGIFNGGAVDESGYSKDGGSTWVPFPSNAPAGAPGNLRGSIAVSTPGDIVWAPAQYRPPFYPIQRG